MCNIEFVQYSGEETESFYICTIIEHLYGFLWAAFIVNQ